MGKMITGSLDLTKLLEQARISHSAFKKADNGHIYINVLVWENEQPDKYGNNFSVQLNAKKDAPETEKKIYVGNLKYQEGGTGAPPTAADIPPDEDLPF
jgi:hypothetical protein